MASITAATRLLSPSARPERFKKSTTARVPLFARRACSWPTVAGMSFASKCGAEKERTSERFMWRRDGDDRDARREFGRRSVARSTAGGCLFGYLALVVAFILRPLPRGLEREFFSSS